MNNKPLVIFFAVLAFICLAIFAYGYVQVIQENPNFWAEFSAQQTDPAYQAQRAADDEADFQKVKPYLWGLLGLFLAMSFGGDILGAIGKPLGILMFFLALIAGIGYLFAYADKNGDGANDPQVIMAVQPQGDDAKNDAAYSKVNSENAKANMTNMMTMGFLWLIGAIVVFILGFVAIYLGSWRKDLG